MKNVTMPVVVVGAAAVLLTRLKMVSVSPECCSGTKSNQSPRKHSKAWSRWRTCEWRHPSLLNLTITFPFNKQPSSEWILLKRAVACCYYCYATVVGYLPQKWDASVLMKSHQRCVWSILLPPRTGTSAKMASCRYTQRRCPTWSSNSCEYSQN